MAVEDSLNMLRNIISKIVLIIGGSLGAICLLIFVDRILGYHLNKTGYFKALKPDFQGLIQSSDFVKPFTIRSQGLREQTVATPKPKGEYRILALGDSFTFGWGVTIDEAWPALLEKRLAGASITSTKRNLQVINAGVPGAGPHELTKICKSYVDQLDIDAVLLVVYTDDFYQAAATYVSQGNVERFMHNLFPTFIHVRQQYIQKLEGLDFINRSKAWGKMVEDSLRKDPNVTSSLDPKIREEFQSGTVSSALTYRALMDSRFMTRLLEPELFEESIGIAKEEYQNLLDDCSKNRPTHMIFLPGSLLVSDYYVPYKKQLGYILNPELPNFDMDSHIKKLAGELGISYISVLSDFRSDGCLDCYYLHDGHMNPRGHERIVDSIGPKIEDWLKGEFKKQ